MKARTSTTVAIAAAGLITLVAALQFGGGMIETEIPGLPSAGPLTNWGLPVARFWMDVCAVACIGTLLAAVVLAPSGSPESSACTRAAGWWALGLAAGAAVSYVLTVSSMIPMPVANLLAFPDLLGFGASIPQTQALLIVLATATVLAPITIVPRFPGWIRLALAAFAILPPAYVGHAASSGAHDVAVSAMVSHLLGVSAWVGGLAAVLVHFRRSERLATVLPRFSTIALCCFAAVALSGLVGAWVRLSTPADLWQTSYGLLLLAKTATLGLLAWFGQNHRRRTVLGTAERSVRHTFVRLAAGEVTVMAVAMGLAVGLSTTPPPVSGHESAAPPPSFTPIALITEFRLDPTVLLLLALPAIGYLIGVRRLSSWPAGRTLSWYAGLALIALVLFGGGAGYAGTVPYVHAVQHVVLSVIAPVLLCLGAPITLAAQATTAASQYGHLGSRMLAWRITHPAVLLVAGALPGILLYGTAWLPWSLSDWAARLATQALFVCSGLLVFWVVAGVDPLPRAFPATARAWLLAAVAVGQLGLGAALMLGPQLAPGRPPSPGVDLLADQRLAGAVFLLLPLLPLAVLAVRLTGRPSGRARAALRTDALA
ncbi:cytochrome c oxidase assembly protein [Nonomuraea sp. NPDC046802]|uniref:cytochrome c oxidase assembly protein n=1 Tax=Nonomuraea sp. NPDC046802 TaxID=3154919 RepID=UPI0033DB0805